MTITQKVAIYAAAARWSASSMSFIQRNAMLYEIARALGLRHAFDERGFWLHAPSGSWYLGRALYCAF